MIGTQQIVASARCTQYLQPLVNKSTFLLCYGNDEFCLQVIQWTMVVLGALMIIVAHLLNSWGILQRNDIEAPNEYQMSIVEHKREDLKRNRKIYWRPNVAHMTRDLAPVGAGIRRASGQAWQRARRFSVA